LETNINNIRDRIFRFLKNFFILVFILFVLRFVGQQDVSFIQFEVLDYILTDKIIIQLIAMLFFIYYGYFVLIDIKLYVDLLNRYMSGKLGTNESNKIKNIAYDIAAIISLILISVLIFPFIRSIPRFGDVLANYLNIFFLAISFLFIYHGLNEIYFLLKDRIEKVIDEITNQMLQESSSRTKKGIAN
jgi:hypothetical protein